MANIEKSQGESKGFLNETIRDAYGNVLVVAPTLILAGVLGPDALTSAFTHITSAEFKSAVWPAVIGSYSVHASWNILSINTKRLIEKISTRNQPKIDSAINPESERISNFSNIFPEPTGIESVT